MIKVTLSYHLYYLFKIKANGVKTLGTQLVFKRTEKKYLVDSEQYNNLIESIKENMLSDEYGKYTICNIYFDTQNFDLIRNSIEKPVFKEKLRLRSYGVPTQDSLTFLEIKRKYKGTVYKRRISLPYCDMMDALSNGEFNFADNQVTKEIEYFIKYYSVVPKVFLAYDREAYKGVKDKGLRITFDTNIRSRETELELSRGDYGELLLNEDLRIMEIKTDLAMPIWLCEALNQNKIYPTSFSKYGNVYKSKLVNSGGFAECLRA